MSRVIIYFINILFMYNMVTIITDNTYPVFPKRVNDAYFTFKRDTTC